jgi:hypothetical protein
MADAGVGVVGRCGCGWAWVGGWVGADITSQVEWSPNGKSILFGTGSGDVYHYNENGEQIGKINMQCLEGTSSLACQHLARLTLATRFQVLLEARFSKPSHGTTAPLGTCNETPPCWQSATRTGECS